MLTIRIDSGVKVTEEKGQPWRKISYRVDQEESHSLIKTLFKACGHPGDAAGTTETIVRIEKSTNWRAALSSAGHKLWPRLAFRICPYHLRNAAASDYKRSGISKEEVSAALGHCVDKTASIYGQFQIGASEGTAPESIRSARKVKSTRSLFLDQRPIPKQSEGPSPPASFARGKPQVDSGPRLPLPPPILKAFCYPP